MTTDKILELARRHLKLTWVNDNPEELIAFAHALLEADRESSDEPVGYLWKSHFIDTRKPIKLWLDEPTWPMGVSSDVPIVPVYTRPAPAQNKLTDEEMNDELVKANVYQAVTAFARAIERRINGEEE